MQLNPAQQQCVEAPGHCLITACPGSGKTKTLASRASYLLTHDPACRVGAVTFTSDAAQELSHRIRKDAQGADGRIVAGTFHKLCKDQLERTGPRLRLASESQAAELIRRAALKLGNHEDPDELVTF